LFPDVGEGTEQGAEKLKLIDEVTTAYGSNIDLPRVNSTGVHNNITLEDPTPREQVTNQDLLRTLLDEVPDLPKQLVDTDDPIIDLCSDGPNDATTVDNTLQPLLYIEPTKDDTISKGIVQTPEKKDTFSLSPDNISKICRTCLKEREVLDIYEHKYDDVPFSEIIELCTPIKLEEDAALSKNICKMCIGELLQAYDFRLRCDKSEKTLKAFQTELAKSIARTESLQEDYVPPFLPFHDYEATLNEEEVQNTILARKRANRKRFYLVKGPADGKGIKLSEIDENNAKALMNDSTRSLMTVRVGNALCNLTKGVLKPGQQLTKAVKDNLKNALVRNLNKRKMLAYSQWITPAIRSVIAGRPSPNVRLLKPKKPRKRKRPLSDKPKDRKLIFPGVCEICNEPYNNIDEYRHHANVTKHYLNPYVCEKCGKVFGDKHRLKTHWEIHHETNEAHMCEICGKRFKTRSYLQFHLKGHTQTAANKEFKCKTCGDVYLRFQDLMLHNRKVHPTTEKKHCCEFCGEFFSRKDTLRHHRNRVHLKIQRQFCHICGKGYLYKSLLKKHMVVHSTLRFD
ncbi:zinc-finger associated domain containing protein, partial [Oryctes borbonicus]